MKDSKEKKFSKGAKSTPKGTSRNRYTKDKGQEAKMGPKSANYAYRDTDKLSPLNDFAWYNRNPLLTQAAASLPFPYRPGMEVQLLKADNTNNTIRGSWALPGVMVLDWAPTIGQSSTALDPASVAAKEIYGKVREKFSGSLDADPPDFIIYLLALDSIFSYIGWLKRVYRIVNTFSPLNYSVPETLLGAMGFTTNVVRGELRTDRMQLFQVINYLIGMTKKFICPAVFDVFNRHYWMNDNVYMDAASANSQMYIFNQKFFYKYTLLNTPAGVPAGGLTLNKPTIGNNAGIVNRLYTFGYDLVNALASSEDAYTISGYLMRAFEGTPSYAVDEITVDERFEPVFVPEVLAQIENSMVATINSGYTFIQASGDISQDPTSNTLISNPRMGTTIAATSAVAYVKPLPMVSIRSDSPTVEDVVEATRLNCALEAGSEEGKWNIICGTEIPLEWRVLKGVNPVNTAGDKVYQYAYLTSSNTVSDIWSDMMNSLYVVGAFDWHPRLTLGLGLVSPTQIDQFLSWDIHNFTTLTVEELRNLHRVCLLSEFNSFGIL